MAEFLFVYRLPENYEVGSEAAVAAWQAWFAGMGEDLIEIGKPVGAAVTVGSCGAGTRLGGSSIVRADSVDEALQVAGRCPAVASDGGVEIGNLIALSAPTG